MTQTICARCQYHLVSDIISFNPDHKLNHRCRKEISMAKLNPITRVIDLGEYACCADINTGCCDNFETVE